MNMFQEWIHQPRAVEAVLGEHAKAVKRTCLVCPTGGGKTRIACLLLERWLDEKKKVVIYTNRKMLAAQLSKVLTDHGIDHGRRQAGHEAEYWPVQISSIGTENARVFKRKKWDLFPADRWIMDEAHLNAGGVARRIIDEHTEAGAYGVGLTATPLDLGDTYETLVMAGTTSELRACGALVVAHHFGVDEPDLKQIKTAEGKDLTEKEAVKAIMRNGIFGRVLENFNKLNPERKPTILFAPGVKESVWFAEQFTQAGIRAAHIDGEQIWLDDQFITSDDINRKMVLDGSEDGSITVLTNRFVLREGIDCPWLAHGIFATVFGSLQSYLQSGGRLLRSHRSLDSVTIQDHGGHWWRHGSLNADREWRLGDTNERHAGLRADRFRRKQEREPTLCPVCHRALSRLNCPCGYAVDARTKSRPVIQHDGTLREMKGDIFRPRREYTRPDGIALWTKMYYRAKNRGATFRQAMALFAYENNWGWPCRDWPLMPVNEYDVFLPVPEVDRDRLYH